MASGTDPFISRDERTLKAAAIECKQNYFQKWKDLPVSESGRIGKSREFGGYKGCRVKTVRKERGFGYATD
jgi:hypothetical protein